MSHHSMSTEQRVDIAFKIWEKRRLKERAESKLNGQWQEASQPSKTTVSTNDAPVVQIIKLSK